ncbi:SulP family inorganic anion transporter [Thioalkalicoccus limnaeus]|uniref:SulP family inorganic anion transporter n=1 Tax=Thioalkalicoccus limnaeus TaxID=120681 RepID=A0ABV4BG39_9GAMM
MSRAGLRADLIAGLSVAMVLIPQSMAYAGLAGLPVVYGLYAAALPVAVAALWGSSRFLHTGPVAMLSLMSAAAIAPFATPGSEQFITLSVMLALMVGVLRLAFGLFRLGVLMNFTSHPVTLGFTNAAALIIGLSLLNTFINVPMPRSDSFVVDLSAVVAQFPHAHWPTVVFGVATLAFLLLMRRMAPRVPAVLLAVLLGTSVSAVIGFEQNASVPFDGILDTTARQAYQALARTRAELGATSERLAGLGDELREAKRRGEFMPELEVEQARLAAAERILERQLNAQRIAAHSFVLAPVADGGAVVGYRKASPGEGGWRVVRVDIDEVLLARGGQVVGDIPRGLPAPALPVVDWEVAPSLFGAALVIALIGFMEATAISRALAAQKREKLDTNQELIGQGLANIIGSIFHAYVVSGSFSRSAVAARAGAQTGFYAVVSALAVVAAIFFLTPYLYHLPQAVLAAIVMTAVFGLIDVKALVGAWRVQRADGVIGLVTFLATLALAPNLAGGVLVGVVLAALAFLIGTMRPRAEVLGRLPTGSLGGAFTHDLPPLSERFVVLRFDASLVFVNVAYFEEAVRRAVASFPKATAVLVIGSGINRIDASGTEAIKALASDLGAAGCTLMFSGLKKPVLNAFERAGLLPLLGKENIYPNRNVALDRLTQLEAEVATRPAG